MSAVKWASKQAVPWKECEGVDTFKMGSMEESNRIQALCRQMVSQDSAKKKDVMGGCDSNQMGTHSDTHNMGPGQGS